jgi:hypothetical protein
VVVTICYECTCVGEDPRLEVGGSVGGLGGGCLRREWE